MAVRRWTKVARNAAKYVAKADVDTITVLLGAGGSFSSGAPMTNTVEDAIFAANEDNFEELAELREELHTLPKDQVENSIKPLFEEIHPHIGYLSLAALARYKRILVVNLNWDSALEKACERLNVEDASLVLDDGVDRIKEHLDNPDYRLVNLHLHGRLGHGPIRFGRRHTLRFDSGEEELVWGEFFSNPTIVVGASLRGEYDITQLLEEASASASDDKAPFWLFSRQAERTEQPEDSVAAELLVRHKSKRNFAGDPYVDFDRLTIELLEHCCDRPFKEVFEGSGLPKPPPEKLVLPDPDLLKNHLDGPEPGRFLAWIGERHVGKSTTARLIAHWAVLRDSRGGQVSSHYRKVDCARAAKGLLQEDAEATENDFVVFEDPFERGGEYERNDGFVEALIELLRKKNAPRTTITCCPSNWRRALLDYPELGQSGEEVCASPTAWYRGLDLAANADDPHSRYPAMVTRRVLEGVASTPARVAAASTMRSTSRDADVVAEKLALLQDLSADEQSFLALVRFYELSSSISPQFELIEHFQKAKATNPAGDACHVLEHFELDGDSFWRFAHYTDRAAFDRLYEEKGEQLLSEVLRLVYGQDIADSVCKVWLAIARLRAGDIEPIEGLGTAEKLEWGPVLLEEAANSRESRGRLAEILSLLPEVHEHDFWSLRELVYEVIRLWPELHESTAALNFLDEVLDDGDRLGRYCVVESLLYFQDTTHSETWERDDRLTELWEKVTAARWRIIKDVEKHEVELALIIDALAWYRPPLPQGQLNRWVERLIKAAEHCPRLQGAFALTSLYHPPAGEMFAAIGRGSPLEQRMHLSEEQIEQAVLMIRWHYVHQSRARALLPRRRLEPANPDYLRRTEQVRQLSAGETRIVQELIERLAAVDVYAGWAVHLGMNLFWTAGNYDADFLGRIVERVPDEDDGLISAVITYGIPDGALDAIKGYFAHPGNRGALLQRMREGCEVGHSVASVVAKVCPPRFNAGRDSFGVHRQLETEWSGVLARLEENPSSDADFVSRVHATLRRAYEKGFVDPIGMSELQRRVRLGDHEALEVARTQPAGTDDPALADWLRSQDEFTRHVVMVARDFGVAGE